MELHLQLIYLFTVGQKTGPCCIALIQFVVKLAFLWLPPPECWVYSHESSIDLILTFNPFRINLYVTELYWFW